MPGQLLNVANGQVAATATAVLEAGPAQNGGYVSATFTNVGGLSETLVVTLSVAGGTQRRLFRAVLAANEQVVLTGLPMNSSDALYATTTNAASVDYVVSQQPYQSGTPPQLCVTVFDANGAIKSGSAAFVGNPTFAGDVTVTGDLAVSGGDIDAGASGAAGTVDVYPSTAAKGKLQLTCTDQTGNTTVTVNAAAMAAARTLTLADPLAAADFLLGKQAAVARTATADGLTTGTIADAGCRQFITVTSADANNIVVLPTPTPGTVVILANGGTGYELRTSTPASIAINGGTGAAAESAIAASTLVVCVCKTATAWAAFSLVGTTLAAVEAAAP